MLHHKKSSHERNNRRQRMIPWLRKHLDSPQSCGVQWLNRAKGEFKIFWAHHGSSGWKRDKPHGQIFKLWAIYSGKHKPGETENWTMWKTRMRCALTRLAGIQEVKSKHDLNCSSPYKVYRFVDSSRETPAGEDNKDEDLDEVTSEDSGRGSIEDSPSPQAHNAQPFLDQLTCLYDNDLDPITVEIMTDEDRLAARDLEDIENLTPVDPLMFALDNAPYSGNFGYASSDCNQFTNQLLSNSDAKYMVKVSYFGETKDVQTVQGWEGCRIAYGGASRYAPQISNLNEVHIELPDCGHPTITPVIDKIRNCMTHGLLIKYDSGNVYASRHHEDKISTFWRDQSDPRDWQKLCRNPSLYHGTPPMTIIFDGDVFLRQYKAFTAGKGNPPSSEVTLTFGHQPQGHHNVNHLPVTVTVVVYRAFSLLNQVGGGYGVASSLSRRISLRRSGVGRYDGFGTMLHRIHPQTERQLILFAY